jgi:serine/threonine protein kinase/WD40 repeat protein/Tfp pilus assembly protein PilF
MPPTAERPPPGFADTLHASPAYVPEDWTEQPKHLPVLEGYEILNELGRGGMGVVYQAWQIKLKRMVALKMISSGPLAGEVERKRFLIEIEAAARLHHPHIVHIYEVGELDGRPFFAMEYVEGGALAHRLAGTPVPARQAAKLLELLARAMDYAHSRGIIHRDLTPGNILLTEGRQSAIGYQPTADQLIADSRKPMADSRQTTLDLGLWTPKITDFGLAKIVIGGGVTQTKTGAVLGTPSYMSPEQATGKNQEIGPATDIYALGAILYELLTGRPPFKAATSLDTVLQVAAAEPVPPTRLQPRIPRDIETICLKCLQKELRNRYDSALALAEDLERFQQGQPILARPISSAERLVRWGRRNPMIAALASAVGLLLILAAIGSSVAALWLRRERDDAVAAVRAMKEQLWQSLRDQARAGVLSRRRGQRFESLRAIREAVAVGRELGLPATDFDELRTLAVSALALPDVRPLREWEGFPPGTRDAACDAKLDRYARGDGAGTVSVRRLADDAEIARTTAFPGGNWLSMSPDGQFMTAHYGESFRVWRLGRNPPTVLMEEAHVFSAGFSPDNRLLFHRSDGSIRLRDLNADGPSREIAKVPGMSTRIAVNPRGDRFALSTGRGVQVRDLATGVLLSLLAPTDRVDPSSIAWHPSGDVIAFAGTDLRVWVWDVRADRALAVLGGFTNSGILPAFTAGGDLLVTRSWENILRFWDWRSARQVLSTPGLFVVPPCCCERLLVQRTEGPTSAAVWQVDAAPEYRTLTVAPAPKQDLGLWWAAVHPRGRILAVATSVGVVLWDIDRGRELATMPEKCWVLAADPSGALLTNCDGILYRRAMTFEPEPTPRLVLGAAERLSLRAPGHAGLDLSRDGRTLALAVFTGVLVQDGQGRVRHLPHSPDCRNVAVSPDGRWVASGSHNGSAARVWRADTGELVKELLTGVGLMQVRFSPAGNWLATTGGGLHLWRAGTWEEGPKIGISPVFAFSPDESLLAAEDGTGRIRLLHPATGLELARLADPNQDSAHDRGQGLLFTPDGRRLIAVCPIGRAVHVWDLAQLRAGLGQLGLDWDAPPYPPAPAFTSPVPITVDAAGLRQPLPGNELPPKDAVAAYTLAIALMAYNPEAHYLRGIARARLRDGRGALDDLGVAIRLNPGQTRYHEVRAEVSQQIENHDLLLEDVERLLVLKPRDAEVNNSLAWIRATGPHRLRDPAKALPHAEAAVGLEPGNALYVNTLGVTLYRLGRYAEAREILEKNAEKQVKEFAAFDLFFLAMCHHQLGDKKKAQSEYEHAVRSFQEHRAELSDPSGIRDLAAFQAEAEALLKQPTPRLHQDGP